MPPSPRLLMALVVILSGVVLLGFLLLGLIWSRLRAVAPGEARRLVEELTRRQEVLEELFAKLEAAGEAARVESRAFPAPRRVGPPSRTSSATRRVDPGEPTAVTGPTLIAIPNLAAPIPPETTAPAEAELGRRFGAIWDLADSGASTEAIARGTGQPIGQVELILALRRQLAANSGSRP